MGRDGKHFGASSRLARLGFFQRKREVSYDLRSHVFICLLQNVQQMLGHRKLENTDFYTQLLNFESDEWHVAHAINLEEENKLVEAGFEFIRYSDKDQVAIYRKRK